MQNENEKQLTAMQVLREKMQRQIDLCNNDHLKHYFGLVNNIIDTELLTTERQQLIDFYQVGTINWDSELTAENYYNNTFKTT